MSRPPKITPWLARRADLPVELVEKLWQRAASEAQTLCADMPDCNRHQLAIERLIDLIESESPNCTFEPASAWIWRHQRRVMAHTASASQRQITHWMNAWNAFSPAHQSRIAA